MRKSVYYILSLWMTVSVWAIPKEFQLRKNDQSNAFPKENQPSSKAEGRGEEFDHSPFSPSQREKRLGEGPDPPSLSTDQITPQRPRHYPERPSKPSGTPPPPLPQYQEDKKSSSPY